MMLIWLSVTFVGVFAALALGWHIGRGQTIKKAEADAISAAEATCPHCHRPGRGAHGKFIKA